MIDHVVGRTAAALSSVYMHVTFCCTAALLPLTFSVLLCPFPGQVVFFNPVLMGPRVDGDYLPAEPEVLMAEGRHKFTDVISGVTAHEGALFALREY